MPWVQENSVIEKRKMVRKRCNIEILTWGAFSVTMEHNYLDREMMMMIIMIIIMMIIMMVVIMIIIIKSDGNDDDNYNDDGDRTYDNISSNVKYIAAAALLTISDYLSGT